MGRKRIAQAHAAGRYPGCFPAPGVQDHHQRPCGPAYRRSGGAQLHHPWPRPIVGGSAGPWPPTFAPSWCWVLSQMAPAQRRPENVICHTDHGSQYTSLAFGQRCREAGIRPSMGTVGDALDNAMCESFFATLECELLDRNKFYSHSEAKMAVFTFIEGWYNPTRRHSALDHLSPMNYERRYPQEA